MNFSILLFLNYCLRDTCFVCLLCLKTPVVICLFILSFSPLVYTVFIVNLSKFVIQDAWVFCDTLDLLSFKIEYVCVVLFYVEEVSGNVKNTCFVFDTLNWLSYLLNVDKVRYVNGNLFPTSRRIRWRVNFKSRFGNAAPKTEKTVGTYRSISNFQFEWSPCVFFFIFHRYVPFQG